ncbi:MAG: YdcF family protein [Thermaurantimonas sp.]
MKKFIKAFLMLTPLLGILMLVFSVLSLWGRQFYRKAMLVLVVFFWIVSTRPGAWLLMKPLENQYETFESLAESDQDAYILVLGGGCNTNGHSDYERLSEASLRRVAEAIRIGQLYPKTSIVLSGTSWRGICDVADYAAVILKKYFPKERINIQYESRDTRQEAEMFKLQFGTQKPVILVTSASHMPRAVRNFKKLGIRVIPAPTDFRIKSGKFWISDFLPSAENLKISETALHEFLGLVYSL